MINARLSAVVAVVCLLACPNSLFSGRSYVTDEHDEYTYDNPSDAQWGAFDRLCAGMALEDFDDTKASYDAAAEQNPVLEILYAWDGYDLFDLQGDYYSNWTAKPQEMEASEITEELKSFFENGKLRQNPNDFRGYRTTGQLDTSWWNRGPLEYLKGINWLSPKNSIDPDIDYLKDRWNKGLGHLVGDMMKYTNRVTGIVYRDANGVHFRRFEPWQAICLPAISSFTLSDYTEKELEDGVFWPNGDLNKLESKAYKAETHAKDKLGPEYRKNRGAGGYFYHHQFEELGRGLVTFDLNYTPASTDENYVPTFSIGLAEALAKTTSYSYSSSSTDEGETFNCILQDRRGWNGADFTGACGFPDNIKFARWIHRLFFNWSDQTGIYFDTITRTGNGYDYQKPVGYTDENGNFVNLEEINKTPSNLTATGDNNSYMPAISSKPTTGSVWFAIDRNKFAFGIGNPTTEEEVEATATTIIPFTEFPVTPSLRHFAIMTSGGGSKQNAIISNLQSRVLNPAKKFRTPPFSKGKFFFWRKEWIAPRPDYLALTFKAQGDCVQVGLANKTYADRIPQGAGSFDSNANYVINASNGVSISKIVDGAATPLTVTTTPGKSALATSDKTAYVDYWITYRKGVIAFGHGKEPGENMVATATDDSPTANIRTYCFSSNVIPVDYTNIGTIAYTTLEDQQIDSTKQTALDTWSADPSRQTIDPKLFGNQFSWFENRSFQTPDSCGMSFSVQRANSATGNAEMLIGLTSSLDEARTSIEYENVDYILKIANNGSISLFKKASDTPLATSSALSALSLTSVSDKKSLWVAHTKDADGNGIFSIGEGTLIGANPLWSHKEPAATKPIMNIAFGAVGVTSSSVPLSYTGIKTTAYVNASSLQTTSDGSYKWSNSWALPTQDQGLIQFTLTPLSTPLVAAIGLRSGAITNDGSPLSGADVSIVFDYTGQVYAVRGSMNASKLGQMRFSDLAVNTTDETQKLAYKTKAKSIERLKSTTDNISCWLSYSNGVCTFGIEPDATTAPGTTPLWSIALTPAPQGITQYSFASVGSTMNIENIATTALNQTLGSSFDVVFADVHTMLLNNPTNTAQQFVSMVDQNNYTNSSKFTSVSQVLAENRELFSTQQRSQLASAINNASYALADSSTIQQYANTLLAEVVLYDLLTAYNTQVDTILTYAPNDARRQLFMAKIAGLANLSAQDLQQPGIVDTITSGILSKLLNQETKLPLASLAESEQQSVTALNIRMTSEATLLATQNPTTVLANLASIPTLGSRIAAIKNLLTARRNNTESDNNVLVFSTENITGIVAALTAITDIRDQLSSTELNELIATIQMAQVTPEVKAQEASLKTLEATARTPIAFEIRVRNLTEKVESILSKPSSDAERQQFFSTIKNIFTQAQDRLPADVKALTEMLESLHTLSASEQSIVNSVRQQARSIMNKSVSFASQLKSAQNTKESLHSYAMTLKDMLENKGFNTMFTSADVAQFVDELEYIVDSRELLFASNELSEVQQLITATKLNADFASERETLTLLESEITTGYTFEDRLEYLRGEIGTLAQQQASTQASPPNYFLKRFILKVEDFKNAVGIATKELFDQFAISVINPLLRFPLSDADKDRVQAVNKSNNTDWLAIQARQSDFGINFSNAQKQKGNRGAYIDALQNIVLALRRGAITKFDQTAVPSGLEQMVKALEELVAGRINLSDNESLELKKTIDFALLTQNYIDRPTLYTRLEELANTMKTPVSYDERVAAFAKDVNKIQVLQPINEERIAFFDKLSALSQSTKEKSVDAVAQLKEEILTPLKNSPELSAQERTILSNLERSASSAEALNRTAQYQLKLVAQAPTISGDGGLVDRLTKMLAQKGSFITFTRYDYATFMSYIAYIVNSRELLEGELSFGSNADDIKTDIKALIMQTKLNSDFANYEALLESYLTLIDQPFNFADRIPVIAEEVATLINQKPEQDSPFLQRLLEKLSLLTSAPGMKTEAQFNTIQSKIMLPLPAILDDAGRTTLKEINEALLTDKAAILNAQKTFAYHFELATEQKENLNVYAEMLRDLMSNIRQGLVACSALEAQTYISELQILVDRQDLLSTKGLEALRSAITFSSYYDQFQSPVYQQQLGTMDQKTSQPLPFAERITGYSAQTRNVLNLSADDQRRIELFTKLKGLISAPGTPTSEALEELSESIIKPLRAAMPSENEVKTLDSLVMFIEKTKAQLQTAAYQLSQAQSIASLPEYIQELTRILQQKDITVVFSSRDRAAFFTAVSYCVESRELLQAGQETTALKTLVRNTQMSADFADKSAELSQFLTDLTTSYYFKDRVDSLAAQTAALIKQRPTADNPFLARLIERLTLLAQAPGTQTDEKFNVLEMKVFGALAPFIPAEHRSTMESVKNALRTQKTNLILQQGNLSYYLTLAEEQQADRDAYLTALQTAVAMLARRNLTFAAEVDRDAMTAAITSLVNERDGLTNEQTNALRTLISACQYSALYKESQDGLKELATLFSAIDTPIEFDILVRKYADELEQILFLSASDSLRMQYFIKLSKLQSAPGFKSAQTLELLTKTILPRLKATAVDTNEQFVLQQFESFVRNAQSSAESVAYQLQQASEQSLDWFSYYKAVEAIATAKNSPQSSLKFTEQDDRRVISALASIVANREMLTTDQLNMVKQLISRLQWLGAYPTFNDQLKLFADQLGQQNTFADRLSNAGEELKAMNIDKTLGSNGRMIRFVKKIHVILDAPGMKTEQNFNDLQTITSILASMSSLPQEQRQQVATVSAAVTSNRDAIIAAQKTFGYHFEQAQTQKDNLSAYIDALKNIITQKRTLDDQNQSLVAFAAPDYRVFINALTEISKDRDALNETDIANLLATVNYTYYAPGFTENAQYKKELTALYNVIKRVVTLSEKIMQYAKQVTDILKLASESTTRKRFFSRIANLQNTEEKPSMDDIANLDSLIVQPLQKAAPSAEEDLVLNNLATFIEGVREQAKSLTYNMGVLSDKIKQAQASGTINPVDVTIDGLNSIVIKRNAGDIVFNDNDYQTIIALTHSLINNRELFTAAQLGRVQGLIRTIQHGAGFENYSEELNTLFTTAGTPLTFAERLEKYRAEIPQVNGLPTDDPSKSETIAKVSTLFNGVGDYTKEQLDIVQSEIVNAIKFGNFTDAQKLRIAPVETALALAQRNLNSFELRLTRAQSTPTLEGYYSSLAQIIADNASGVVTMTPADYTAIMNILEKEVPLRPLSTDVRSGLYSLIQMVAASGNFNSRVDYKARLDEMMATINTSVDLEVRAQYFSDTVGSTLNQDAESGERQRFFDRLSSFSTALNTMITDTTIEQARYDALKLLETTCSQYAASALATDAEKAIFTQVSRKIMALTLGLTPTTTTTVATTATSTGSNIVPVASSAIRRNYRYAPSRYSR